MRAELVTRPTVKQWTSKLRELSESEGKRLDLVAIRRESLEVLAERERENKRHMSVHQQVLTDKRNDQSDLWVLDSLSSEHTKNALKAVCRELGLTDVGDIQPSLIKLKAVVGAVPRMERFITQVQSSAECVSSLLFFSLVFRCLVFQCFIIMREDVVWCQIGRCDVTPCVIYSLPSPLLFNITLTHSLHPYYS